MEGTSLNSVFVAWWYRIQFRRIWAYFKRFLVYLFDLFSIRICLRTLFAVWRRDMISYEGLSLQQSFQAWLLNLASRFVGLFVKVSTIIAYLVVTLLVLLIGLSLILVWFLYPVIVLFLLGFGVWLMWGSV